MGLDRGYEDYGLLVVIVSGRLDKVRIGLSIGFGM